MNGMATVYPRHVSNICWCGHDYREHIYVSSDPNNVTNVCNNCLGASNGLPSQHSFVGRNEGWPKFNFTILTARGYYASGNLNQPPNLAISQASGQPLLTVQTAAVVGATAISINGFSGGTGVPVLINSRLIGGTIMFRGAANPQRTDMYRITNITPNAPANLRTVSFAPPVRVQINANVNAFIFGADGSQAGPGLPPNGQRAG